MAKPWDWFTKVALVALVALPLAACGGKTASTDTTTDVVDDFPTTVASSTAPAAAYTWYTTEPVRSTVAALQTASADIVAGIKSTDVSAVKAGCRELKAGVRRFRSGPLAPDTQVRDYFYKSMTDYAQAAAECLDSNFADAGQSLMDGNVYTRKATARITELGP